MKPVYTPIFYVFKIHFPATGFWEAGVARSKFIRVQFPTEEYTLHESNGGALNVIGGYDKK
jgi:hypothetical protein